MPTGRVKFLNTDRGFGFILPDEGGPDVFVHVHDVETAGMKTLVAGQVLAYTTTPARDGRLKAVNLRFFNAIPAASRCSGIGLELEREVLASLSALVLARVLALV